MTPVTDVVHFVTPLLTRLLALLLSTLVTLSVNAAGSEFRASRLATKPVIDGNVASDPAWRGLAALSSFTQVQPIDGSPASQPTRIHIGFDDDTLYIAAICYDDQPENIIVTSTRRDASVTESDSLLMIIDTFQSRQNGLVFGTNPGGMQYDAQVSGFDFDRNWDTTWKVATTVHDTGWSAEFAIPFTSLRYKPGKGQTWGINFERRIRHNNEVAYWSPIPIRYSLSRVELAGSVSGIDVPRQRNFQLIPYVTSRHSKGGSLTETDTDTEAGLDLKYALTSGLTLDVTWNTDFAQVEVDSLQVNLNRFNLFFPEKRPFFLENAGQFSVGVPGLMELFHTRRIGIGPGGSQLPIDAGVRVSGKTGRDTNLGLLFMRTGEVTGLAEDTDFGVVRLKQEFHNRSSAGVLLVSKENIEGDNRTFALDGQVGIGDNLTLSGFVAATDSTDTRDDDSAIFVSSSYADDEWSWSASLSAVGNGFNPEVGFLNRRDFERIGLHVQKRIRFNESSSILELRPHARYSGYWRPDGFYQTGFLHLDNAIIWKSGAELWTAVNFIHEGVERAFPLAQDVIVEAADYDDAEISITTSTNRSAPVSLAMNVVRGGFFGGDRLAVSPSITWRRNDAFSASLSWRYNDVSLPTGGFDIALTTFRMNYSFTPNISLQALVQHNDRDDLLATNIRFSWLSDANSGLFVVYNETDDGRRFPGTPRREFLIKYSRILNL